METDAKGSPPYANGGSNTDILLNEHIAKAAATVFAHAISIGAARGLGQGPEPGECRCAARAKQKLEQVRVVERVRLERRKELPPLSLWRRTRGHRAVAIIASGATANAWIRPQALYRKKPRCEPGC
jgi:hypothetical protein